MKELNQKSALRTVQTIITAMAVDAKTTFQNVMAAVMYCQLAGLELGYRFTLNDGRLAGVLGEQLDDMATEGFIESDEHGHLSVRTPCQAQPMLPDPTVSQLVRKVCESLPCRSPERMHYYCIAMWFLQRLLDDCATAGTQAKLLDAYMDNNPNAASDPLLTSLLSGDAGKVESLGSALLAGDQSLIRDGVMSLLIDVGEDEFIYAFGAVYDGEEEGDDLEKAESRVVTGCRIIAKLLQSSSALVKAERMAIPLRGGNAAERAGQMSFGF